ncbi:MAG TPA: PepSY-like domain-containing protein [Bacteroidota bacterium]|nr:PepSY-like domain-containing protein [Bacteroidota bacterium]
MRRHRILSPARILLIAALISPSAAPAQEKKISKKEVPAAVLEAFAKSYPHAKIRGTSTEMEKGTRYYEIESMDGTQARDILYLADGTASEVEEVVSPASLPDKVKGAVAKEFAGAKIVKAEKSMKGNDMSYEIHVTAGGKRGSIVVSPAGAVLEKSALKAKKEKKETEEKDDEEDD